jgi:para-aminobenzoate synthetase/4-amino-4-deoxychorismate lyase
VWKIALAKQPVTSSDCLLYHKTTRRAVYEAALNGHPDCNDVILFNECGELTESCYANLVVVRRNRWLTPPVSCGLLAGTLRAELLAQGKLIEKVLRVSDLKNTDRILLINSVRGVIETTWNN